MFHENKPSLWREHLPVKAANAHKYDCGHAVVYGAAELTGATRLAVESCARMGAGLVSVLAPPGTFDIYRTALPAHILVRNDLSWWDERISAVLYGPGGLPVPVTIRDIPTVLDADALGALPENLHDNVVLTPHEGEFARVFPAIGGSREERAMQAARDSSAIIVLKGAKTVIAHPDGLCVVNDHASPYLATAGTGDVLAGMITGLAAQGMNPFNAACAAVWMHGDAALRFGVGLVATDLPGMLPQVLKALQASPGAS